MKRYVLAAALAAGLAAPADAAVFTFSYATQSGITAQGSVTATNQGGFYTVDDVTGTRGGQAITGYDFFDPTPQSFEYVGGQPRNVDFSYYVGGDNYEIRWPGAGQMFGTEFRTTAAGAVTSLLVTSFSLQPAQVGGAVPEPASWALMIAGFGLTGAAMRRKRVAVAVAVAFA